MAVVSVEGTMAKDQTKGRVGDIKCETEKKQVRIFRRRPVARVSRH